MGMTSHVREPPPRGFRRNRALVDFGWLKAVIDAAEAGSRLVFSVEQREARRDRLLRLAEEDERVVAGAAVGSLAVDAGDRFSDLDLHCAPP